MNREYVLVTLKQKRRLSWGRWSSLQSFYIRSLPNASLSSYSLRPLRFPFSSYVFRFPLTFYVLRFSFSSHPSISALLIFPPDPASISPPTGCTSRYSNASPAAHLSTSSRVAVSPACNTDFRISCLISSPPRSNPPRPEHLVSQRTQRSAIE